MQKRKALKSITILFLLIMTLSFNLSNKGAAETYDFSDLNGKSIAVLTGSVQEKLVAKLIPGAVIQYFDAPTDMVLALQQKKIDAFAMPYLYVQIILKDNEDLTCDARLLGADDVCFAFAKTEKGKKYHDEFNEFLKKYQESNSLKKWGEIYLEGDPEKFTYFDFNNLSGKNGTIAYGTTTQMPPFSFMTGNGICGMDMELIYRFCEMYGYKIDIEDTVMASELAGLSTGAYDMGGGGIAYSAERAENVYFSAPYFQSKQVLVELKGSGIGMGNESEINEKVISGIFKKIKRSFERTFLLENRWKLFLQGLLNTLIVTVCATLLASVIGIGVTWLMCSKVKAVRTIVKIYHNLMQGLPIVVVLMFLYYVLFSSVRINPKLVAIFAFGLSYGPGMGEGLYGAIQSVIKGEQEASLALGFTPGQTFFYITLPQALRKYVSGYRSQIVGLLKGTSVVGYIAIQDITKMADIIRSRSFEAFFPILTSAAVYFTLIFMIQWFFDRILKKLDHTGKRKEVKGV